MRANTELDSDSMHDLLSLLPPKEWLAEVAAARSREYRENTPFPHICIDDFLPLSVAEAINAAFPGPAAAFWNKTEIAQEKKLSTNDESNFPPLIRNLLYAMNGGRFLTFLEKLTGVDALLPDPYFNGGGLHQIVRGGKLGIHLDFNQYPRLETNRCLNVLIYLNRDWKDEYGGHLELWDADKKQCAKKILPLFNRCVIFNTTGRSFHGHPHPLTCPEGRTRRSLALYYYRTRAEKELARGTQWLSAAEPRSAKALIKKIVRNLTPPLVYEATRKLAFKLGLFDG